MTERGMPNIVCKRRCSYNGSMGLVAGPIVAPRLEETLVRGHSHGELLNAERVRMPVVAKYSLGRTNNLRYSTEPLKLIAVQDSISFALKLPTIVIDCVAVVGIVGLLVAPFIGPPAVHILAAIDGAHRALAPERARSGTARPSIVRGDP